MTSTGHRPPPLCGHTLSILNRKAYLIGGCGPLDETPQVFDHVYSLGLALCRRFVDLNIEKFCDQSNGTVATMLVYSVWWGACVTVSVCRSRDMAMDQAQTMPLERTRTPSHPTGNELSCPDSDSYEFHRLLTPCTVHRRRQRKCKMS